MSGLSDTAKHYIMQAMQDAGHGERTSLAKRLADTYGVSVSTVYKCAGRNGTKRNRQASKSHYREWVRTAAALANSVPGNPLPLDLAITGAIQNGSLPDEASDMPIGTAYRLAREQGLVQAKKRTHRLSADYPMQALQIDGSSSECLVVAKELPDGDYLLKLHRRPYSASGYKNKPLGPNRLRVLIYAGWDMCSGYNEARYCVAKGENALDAMDFLCWLLADSGNPRRPMHGVPDDLWSDQGPLFKSGPARDLVDRLDINLVTGEAYAKERMGGVERTHRTRWQRFEKSLFLRGQETVTLSELNERLYEFCAQENARRDARVRFNGRRISRTDAWIALTNGRPADNPLRKLPDNPIETMAQEVRRRVDQNGILSWNNVEYELATIHDCWVIARRAMDGSSNVVVEDERDGQRYIATAYVARGYGHIIGAPTTALDKLKEAEQTAGGADIYVAKSIGNIIPMRPRSAGAGQLDNPLSAEQYADIDEAMTAFTQLYPHPLSRGSYQSIREHIQGADCNKLVVAELAQELLTLKKSNIGE